MSQTRHEENARKRQQEVWNQERALPWVAPGSHEEALALARIDQLRHDHNRALYESPHDREKKRRRYYGNRSVHVRV